MNKILNNNKQNINTTHDKKNNTNKSSINDLLASSVNPTNFNKTNKSTKQPNEIIDILEDDYKSISSQTNANKQKGKNSLAKNFLPNRNKQQEKSRNLNQIITILKSDYRCINTAYEKFQYLKFDSINDTKMNIILNQLEETVFSRFQSLNQLSNLANSNLEINEALQEIFKIEDVINHCVMHAYNIYCLMKMYQYKRNFSNKKNTNDNSKNNSRFYKKQFDSAKFARDTEIRRLDGKSSTFLSSTEISNLRILKQERSIMEGFKSNIRLGNIDKNRTQFLKEEIINSKRILSGTVFNANSNSYDFMNNLASKSIVSAENSSKFFSDFSQFY